MNDGFYLIESHSGTRHFCYIENGLVYFCGEAGGESVQMLIEDDWKLLHDSPLAVDGYVSIDRETKDPIVDQLISEYRLRSEKGIAKYRQTLAENVNDDFLQHLKEELMDAALYITKLQSE